MTKLLDRLLTFSYIKAYLICLISMLGLYIVVDLFMNLEDFAQNQTGLVPVLLQIGKYYGVRVTQIFDRLCEAIVLLAAMFTVAWIQRNNEILPLLSAGVSTRRVVRPVLLSACLFLGLSIANQEYLIPQVGSLLFNNRDDPDGVKDVVVQGAFEPNGIHIEGQTASRAEKFVREFNCVIPETITQGNLINLHAREGRYIPPEPNKPRTGGWLLIDTQPAQLPDWARPADMLEFIDDGKYFLKTQEVNFEVAIRSHNWFMFTSTSRLYQELQRADSSRLASMAVVFHMRLTRPILGLFLVFMGLSVILRDQNRNVFISAGMCLVLCAIFFATTFLCKHLGDSEFLSPALAAWLPVLIFGPVSFVLFDAIHT
jgi:lipopolysaccharide export system permease protein